MASSTPTLTPEQQAEARREAKAQKERDRRAAIKAAQDALEKAGLSRDTELTKEQRDRAAVSGTEKGGLRNAALAAWIMDGKTSTEQVEEAKTARKAAEKEDRTRANVTRSADPEAASLAAEAKSLAPDVKSAFLPKDAREFLDLFKVERALPTTVTISRTDSGAESITINVKQLEAFAKKGEKDTDVRKALSAIGKGSRLWGRKLGLMALAVRLRQIGAEK